MFPRMLNRRETNPQKRLRRVTKSLNFNMRGLHRFKGRRKSMNEKLPDEGEEGQRGSKGHQNNGDLQLSCNRQRETEKTKEVIHEEEPDFFFQETRLAKIPLERHQISRPVSGCQGVVQDPLRHKKGADSEIPDSAEKR